LIPSSGVVRKAAWLAALAACCTACLYGFAGGGLPPHIRTVAILPFDNQTTDPQLTQQVNDAVREAFESRLGLRLAGEATADAVVRGTIVRFEPEIAVSFQAAQQATNQQVNRRLVRLSLNVEVFDQREGRSLWKRDGLTVDGEYTPPNEADGRQAALKKLVSDIVDGAQSQW
jgi:TolB-like protein